MFELRNDSISKIVISKLSNENLFQLLHLQEDLAYDTPYYGLTASHVLISKSSPEIVEYILRKLQPQQIQAIMRIETSTGKPDVDMNAQSRNEIMEVLKKILLPETTEPTPNPKNTNKGCLLFFVVTTIITISVIFSHSAAAHNAIPTEANNNKNNPSRQPATT